MKNIFIILHVASITQTLTPYHAHVDVLDADPGHKPGGLPQQLQDRPGHEVGPPAEVGREGVERVPQPREAPPAGSRREEVPHHEVQVLIGAQLGIVDLRVARGEGQWWQCVPEFT